LLLQYALGSASHELKHPAQQHWVIRRSLLLRSPSTEMDSASMLKLRSIAIMNE